jgi:hypothetical protein
MQKLLKEPAPAKATPGNRPTAHAAPLSTTAEMGAQHSARATQASAPTAAKNMHAPHAHARKATVDVSTKKQVGAGSSDRKSSHSNPENPAAGDLVARRFEAAYAAATQSAPLSVASPPRLGRSPGAAAAAVKAPAFKGGKR